MITKPFVLGLLATACVTAAAGGAYMAVRQNQSAEAVPAVSVQAPVPDKSEQAVAETEAVVSSPGPGCRGREPDAGPDARAAPGARGSLCGKRKKGSRARAAGQVRRNEQPLSLDLDLDRARRERLARSGHCRRACVPVTRTGCCATRRSAGQCHATGSCCP